MCVEHIRKTLNNSSGKRKMIDFQKDRFTLLKIVQESVQIIIEKEANMEKNV